MLVAMARSLDGDGLRGAGQQVLVVALHRACACKAGRCPEVVLLVLMQLGGLPAAAMCGAVVRLRRWPQWQDTLWRGMQDTVVAPDRHAACLCFVETRPTSGRGLISTVQSWAHATPGT